MCEYACLGVVLHTHTPLYSLLSVKDDREVSVDCRAQVSHNWVV